MWLIWLAFGGTVSVGIELYEGIELPDVCYRIQPHSRGLGWRYGEADNEQEGEAAQDRPPVEG